MDVLVVRHAIALDKDEAKTQGMLDRDRPLTSKGRARMQQIARALAKRAPELSALISSPLRRAVETAEVLSEQYESVHPTESDTLLPNAEPADLLHFLADAQFDFPVAVVGHEPHLSSWVSWCLSGRTVVAPPSDASGSIAPASFIELRKGGACLLRFESTPGAGKARLLWLMTPALMRRL